MIVEPSPASLDVPILTAQTIRRGMNADKVPSLLEVGMKRLSLVLVQNYVEISWIQYILIEKGEDERD